MIGWRWFSTTPAGGLISFNSFNGGDPWPPDDVHEAYCANTGMPWALRHCTCSTCLAARASGGFPGNEPVHGPAPDFRCSCGFYMFKWSEDALALPYVGGYRKLCKVLAVCECWGEIVEHDIGFRAQYARIRAIHSVRGKVHPAYEVDRARNVEQMIERWEVPDDAWDFEVNDEGEKQDG